MNLENIYNLNVQTYQILQSGFLQCGTQFHLTYANIDFQSGPSVTKELISKEKKLPGTKGEKCNWPRLLLSGFNT